MPSQLAERRYPAPNQAEHFVWCIGSDRRITSLVGGAAKKIPGLDIGLTVDEINADRPDILAFVNRLFDGEEVAMKVVVDGVWWMMEGGPCWLNGKVIGCAGVTYALERKPEPQRQRWKAIGPASTLHPDVSVGDVIVKTEGVSGVTKFNTHTDAEFMEWMVRSGRQLEPIHPSQSVAPRRAVPAVHLLR